MKCLPLSEFPPPSKSFPLTVELQSSILAMRDGRRSRQSHTWVEANFCARGQVMRVRSDVGGELLVSSLTSPDEPTVAVSSVTPAGLDIGSLHWPRRRAVNALPVPVIPESFSVRKDGIVTASIATDRTTGRVRPARFTADRSWVAADLLNVRRNTWVRVELYRDGKVWIGVPGLGQGLIGLLDETGLSLTVRSQAT
jgi:hypothetical protein